MRRLRPIETVMLASMLLIFAAGSSLIVLAQREMDAVIRYLTQGIGIWPLAEQERQVLRLRELVSQRMLGAPLEQDAYMFQRDLVASRIQLHGETVRGDPDLFPNEQQLVLQLEAAFKDYLTMEGGALPSAAVARQLVPVLDRIATLSHDAANVRRDATKFANLRMTQLLRWMQQVQIGTLVLLGVVGSGLFWLTRKTLSNDLAAAYTEARQRSAELETSQTQLQIAHQHLQQHNEELTRALTALETTIQERTELESTVQQLTFPIVPVLDGILVVPLIGTLDRERLQTVATRLLTLVSHEQTQVVIIDITGVLAIDAIIGQELRQIAQAIELLGCLPILVGITPKVAEGLVQIGFGNGLLVTRSTLQQGVEYALHRRNQPLYRRN